MCVCISTCGRIKEAVITDCSFYDNVVAVNGGGMFQEDTSGSLNNCMFKGNKALVRGTPADASTIF